MRPAASTLVLLLAMLAAWPAVAGDDLLVILDTVARRAGPGSPADRYLDHTLLNAGTSTRVEVVAVTAQGARPLVSARLRLRPGLRNHQKLAVRHILDRWLAGEPGTAPPPDTLGQVIIDRLRAAPADPGRGLTLILISDLNAEPPAAEALQYAAPPGLEVEALGPGSAAAPDADRAGAWEQVMAEAGVAWSYLPLVMPDSAPTEAEDGKAQ